ncbi:hypothetical protein [Brachyspira murdochii]|nr:hypothetical protein [Brachyspira murdochii]
MIKNILTLSLMLLIISCSNNNKNNQINNNKTNTNLIETQTNETKTNELKQDEELNNNNTKNIEWISHYYYMKNDEGDFFSVYLNDRWPDYINNDSELIPNYKK